MQKQRCRLATIKVTCSWSSEMSLFFATFYNFSASQCIFSYLYIFSVAVQSGLCRTRSETPNIDFVATQLKLFLYHGIFLIYEGRLEST